MIENSITIVLSIRFGLLYFSKMLLGCFSQQSYLLTSAPLFMSVFIFSLYLTSHNLIRDRLRFHLKPSFWFCPKHWPTHHHLNITLFKIEFWHSSLELASAPFYEIDFMIWFCHFWPKLILIFDSRNDAQFVLP